MAEKLTKRIVDGLKADGKAGVVWDRDLPGFGVRVYPSGRKTYVVQTRGPNGSRRVTLGRHGDITARQARQRAASAIDRIKSGQEPLTDVSGPKTEPTVADLAERFLEQHVAVRCKPSTARRYRQVIENQILPSLGELPVAGVGRKHVVALHYDLRHTPNAANKARQTLATMFTLARDWGLRSDGVNPCRGVRSYRERHRERFVNREEYGRIGRVLDEAKAAGSPWPAAVAAIRLLIFTGCRSREMQTLKWSDIDRAAGEIRLADSKTGPRPVPLTAPVQTVLDGLERENGNPWVFAGRRPGTHVGPLGQHWRRLRVRAGLDDVRLHDLRHSYASRALELGESLPMIGKLLGHNRVQTTARYAHLASESEKRAVAKVAASIESDALRAANALRAASDPRAADSGGA